MSASKRGQSRTRTAVKHCQRIAEQESQAVNADRFLSVVRRYTEIKELTSAIVHEFIDRISILFYLPTFFRMYSSNSSTDKFICSIVSLSLTVTISFSSVLSSTVTVNGIPIASPLR